MNITAFLRIIACLSLLSSCAKTDDTGRAYVISQSEIEAERVPTE